MQITRAIEYLLTLSRPGGGRLVGQEHTQIRIPVFPAGITLGWSAGPAQDDFAQIVAGIAIGKQMVPDAFSSYLQISGTRVIQGIIGSAGLYDEWAGFVWVTVNAPLLFSVTNRSSIDQEFEVNYASLRISSRPDYDLVLDALDHMATSSKSEELARDAVNLLTIISGGG